MLQLIKNEHKNHETKDHIHCTWTDCCLSIDNGSSIKTSHFRAWRARYSRELFCLFHECCVYFTSVRCRDWRHIDLNRVSKRTIKFLLIRPKTRLHIFLSKYITLVLMVLYLFVFIMCSLFFLALFSLVLILMKALGGYFCTHLL